MNQPVRPIPEGFHTITPHLVCEGATKAIAFYEQAFGAVVVDQMPGPDGKLMHALLRIGDSHLMLCDDFPEYGSPGPRALGGTTVTIHLYVPDADAAWERALAAGATPSMPLSDMFWGDRYGQVTDPYGHRWSLATHQRDLSQQEIMDGMNKMMAAG